MQWALKAEILYGSLYVELAWWDFLSNEKILKSKLRLTSFVPGLVSVTCQFQSYKAVIVFVILKQQQKEQQKEK